MKKIDDKDIVEMFKSSKDYEVKKDANTVFNAFLKSQKTEEKTHEKVKKSHKNYFIFGGIGVGSLAIAAASMLIVFGLNNNAENPDSPGGGTVVVPPNLVDLNRNALTNELLTFSSFGNHQNSENRANKILLNAYRRNNLSEKSFSAIVDSYDSINQGVLDILNKEENVKMEIAKEVNEEIDGTIYKFVDNYYSSSDEFKKSFMSFYYQDKDFENSVSSEHPQNGLMKYGEEYFECLIQKETENEEDEFEQEVNILLINKDNNKVTFIEKEHEYEGKESENTYSIAEYDSENAFRRDEDNFTSKLTYEIENEGREEEIEISVETRNYQCEFQNVRMIDEDPLTYLFTVEYENEISDIEVEDCEVKLVYEDGKRTYSTGENLKVTKN